jgi:acyl dehydratase
MNMHYEDYEVGTTRRSAGRTITETDIVMHAGQTGDFYPHHMDSEFASRNAIGQRIAHGTLILSVAVGMVAGDINEEAMSYGYDRIRFVRPVHIGDTITVTARIEACRTHPRRPEEVGIVEEVLEAHNQRIELVMTATKLYIVNRSGEATA